VDPERRGRLMITVPDVLGLAPSTWAEPCVPLSGAPGVPMGIYTVPPLGSAVWVEFEQGDPDHPVWVGCLVTKNNDVPEPAQSIPPGLPVIVLQGMTKHYIQISDVPGIGGITLKTLTGATISVTDLGITLDNGKGATILMTGPTVTVNNGALVIT
jgi:uncharacterized protein involved in type VI secretion and phage assembly